MGEGSEEGAREKLEAGRPLSRVEPTLHGVPLLMLLAGPRLMLLLLLPSPEAWGGAARWAGGWPEMRLEKWLRGRAGKGKPGTRGGVGGRVAEGEDKAMPESEPAGLREGKGACIRGAGEGADTETGAAAAAAAGGAEAGGALE